jgi:hypothetical protein
MMCFATMFGFHNFKHSASHPAHTLRVLHQGRCALCQGLLALYQRRYAVYHGTPITYCGLCDCTQTFSACCNTLQLPAA